MGVEIRSGSEADEILNYRAKIEGVPPESMHAVTLGDDLILVRDSHVNNVRVLREELLHTQQQKIGFEISYSSVTQAEIQVRKQMISQGYEWGLTRQEIQELHDDISTIKLRGGY